MANDLRILMVEDSEDDAHFIQEGIKTAGYELTVTRVETAGAMQAALEQQDWDLILSDHSMPGFSAPAALNVLH